MNDPGKSDRPEVPTKQPNKAGKPGAEVVEGRGLAEGNTDEQNASRTQSRNHDVPSALDRVREAARKDRKAKCTALTTSPLSGFKRRSSLCGGMPRLESMG